MTDCRILFADGVPPGYAWMEGEPCMVGPCTVNSPHRVRIGRQDAKGAREAFAFANNSVRGFSPVDGVFRLMRGGETAG